MAARVVYNEAELHHLLEAPAGPTGTMLLRKARNVEARARTLADSRLKRSTRPGVHYHDAFVSGVASAPLMGFAGNDADHAMGLEVGNRPHIIRAKNAPYLVFFWPKVGRVVRFKSVNHPGSKSYHVLADALAAVAET